MGGTDQLRVFDLWVTDRMPASNAGNADDGDRDLQLEPPRSGTIFRVAEFEPNAGDTPEPAAKAAAALFQDIQGTHSQFDTSRHPQMHRTASIDYIVILSGRITLMLDEGDVELGPYDTPDPARHQPRLGQQGPGNRPARRRPGLRRPALTAHPAGTEPPATDD